MNHVLFGYERNGIYINFRTLFFCTFPLTVQSGKEIQLYAFIVDLFETRNEVRVQILFIEYHTDVLQTCLYGFFRSVEISLKCFT